MLEINKVRQYKDRVIELLKVKRFKLAEEKVNALLAIDDKRKENQKRIDEIKTELNQKSKEIGQLMQQQKADLAQKAKERVAELKEKVKQMESDCSAQEQEIKEILLSIPNTPNPDVPQGKGEEDNVVEYQEGEIPKLYEGALPHWELCAKYDIIDFDLGNKITGAGFPVYKGKGAKLQRALINFFLDQAQVAGFLEVQPPLMVNEASATATGQLPDKEAQMYVVTLDKFYMIPTAEVPITNIFRDTIVNEKDFPIKCCAYSQCFRREAGSYGKDVRGLNRLHQFDKVEIVCIDSPEHSYTQLEEMKAHVAGLLKKLGLPFHVLRLCGGDLSFTSAITFDFETYSAAQKRWLEVSSVSNFETYQSNRLHLRYKNSEGKMQLAHTLNGSALALPRIVASLLENYQTPEGIIIPECLRKYTGFDKID
jgi:seryl-tRNA synthetase